MAKNTTKWKHLLLSGVILALGLFWLWPKLSSPVFAQAENSDFSTDLVTSYTVTEAGTTKVTHDITITNLKPTRYITNYALKLSNKWEISGVSVTTNSPETKPNIVQTEQATSIGISFADELVGEGKQRQIHVSYTTPDAAQKLGNVLEVHIPRLQQEQPLNSYQVNLITPSNLGIPVKTNVSPNSTQQSDQNITTSFVGDDAKNGISAFYGNKQSYDLDLTYRLINPNDSVAVTQIALPPTTTYQEVTYHAIEPQPASIEQDTDGNWLANYELQPRAEITVVAKATAHNYLEPLATLAPPKSLQPWLESASYWELSDQTLSEILHQGIGSTPVESIYRSVLTALNYTKDPILAIPDRKGAAGSLEQPNSATCQEFTDLFIALARKNGIPARRVVGFAYTNNTSLRPVDLGGDVLHSWPEYWDATRKHWVAVDPTWEDTTDGIDYFKQFDLNHVAFAYNGVSSTLPFPAGAYVKDSDRHKDVSVRISPSEVAFPEPTFEFNLQSRLPITLPFSGWWKLRITNQTGRTWYHPKVGVERSEKTRDGITIVFDDQIPTEILPWQTIEIPVAVYTTYGNRSFPIQLSLHVTDVLAKEYYVQTNLIIPSGFPGFLTDPVVQTGLVVGCIVIALGAGSLLVYWSKRSNTVRRKSQKLT